MNTQQYKDGVVVCVVVCNCSHDLVLGPNDPKERETCKAPKPWKLAANTPPAHATALVLSYY